MTVVFRKQGRVPSRSEVGPRRLLLGGELSRKCPAENTPAKINPLPHYPAAPAPIYRSLLALCALCKQIFIPVFPVPLFTAHEIMMHLIVALGLLVFI